MSAIKRLFDYIHVQFDEGSIEKFIGKKYNNGWEFYSTDDIIVFSRQLASGLLNAGYTSGDKIGLVVYENSPEWMIADLAIQYIGAISVPMYPTISPREYEYIINESEMKCCFVGDKDLSAKVTQAAQNTSNFKIYSFFPHTDNTYWKEILSESKLTMVESLAQSVSTDDVVTIIYTSGTTGNPKGVVLTHKNIIAAVESTLPALPVKRGYKVLSFLPFCHIFERAVIYAYQKVGVEVYTTGTDNLGGETGDLATVKPHFFTTVPRLLEKVYEKIYNKGLELTGIKKLLFFWALDMTNTFEFGQKPIGFDALKYKIADKLIYSKWRTALGGNVIAIVTGAAACPEKIIRTFSGAGIGIVEGYGLTETSPTISINNYDLGLCKVGTVGQLVPNIEVLISEAEEGYAPGEGEILISGPNVMKGYYKQPEMTDSVFTELKGIKYFKTGDIGKFVTGPKGERYLKITDRKKELLKTSGGKYVAPTALEGKLKEEFLIEQAMIVGDGQKYVSALIVPNADALTLWAKSNEINQPYDQLFENLEVIAKFQDLINGVNANFSHVEQIKKFALIKGAWEPIKQDGSDAELTPTLKLKRRVLLSKYQAEIEAMYLS